MVHRRKLTGCRKVLRPNHQVSEAFPTTYSPSFTRRRKALLKFPSAGNWPSRRSHDCDEFCQIKRHSGEKAVPSHSNAIVPMCSDQGYPYRSRGDSVLYDRIACDRGRRKYSKTCRCGPKSDIETWLCQGLEMECMMKLLSLCKRVNETSVGDAINPACVRLVAEVKSTHVAFRK